MTHIDQNAIILALYRQSEIHKDYLFTRYDILSLREYATKLEPRDEL